MNQNEVKVRLSEDEALSLTAAATLVAKQVDAAEAAILAVASNKLDLALATSRMLAKAQGRSSQND